MRKTAVYIAITALFGAAVGIVLWFLLTPQRHGVVVETVQGGFDMPGHGFEAEVNTAGIKPGDLLLDWLCNGTKRPLDSPFALSAMIFERYACGREITIEGRRGGVKRSWTLPAGKPQYDFLFRGRPDFGPAALAAYTEGERLAGKGEFAAARERWEKIPVSVGPGYAWLRSWLLLHMADSLDDHHQFRDADGAYREALEEARRTGTHWVLKRVHYEWADALVDRYNFNGAAQHYREALTEDEKDNSKNSLLSGFCLNGIATAALHQGDLAKAQEYYQRAVQISERLAPGTLYTAAELTNLGTVSERCGDLRRAEECLRKALEIGIDRYGPDSIDLAHTLTNFGTLLVAEGQFSRAEEYHRRALAISEKTAPNTSAVATCLQNLGAVARARGNLDEAEDFFRRSLKIRSRGSFAEATLQNNLGNIALKKGDLKSAELYLNSARSALEQPGFGNLGLADSLYGLGDLARTRGESIKAKTRYRQALRIRESLAPGSISYAETLAALARIERDSLEFGAAANLYEQALSALEAQTSHLGGGDEIQAEFRGEHANYYLEYIDVLLRQNNRATAFEMVERSRAQSLLETLLANKIDVYRSVDAGTIGQARLAQASLSAKSALRMRILTRPHSQEELADIDKAIIELSANRQTLETKLRDRDPSIASLTRFRPLTVREVQDGLLDADTVLLEYALSGKRSYLFAVSRRSFSVHNLPGRAVIENLTSRWYDLLKSRDNSGGSEIDRLAANLSRILLEPVAREIRGKRLLLVADGGLQYIPFGALPAPRASIQPGQASAPLVVEHEIVHLPSATVLGVLRRGRSGQRRPDRAIAVFADPVFSKKDLRLARVMAQTKQKTSGVNPPLEASTANGLHESSGRLRSETVEKLDLPRLYYTRNEARAILASAPQAQEMVALDFAANRARVISGDLARYRIVHFATHTLLDTAHPELSGLVLSLVDERGSPQNGFLGLEDIYHLELSADLVVLSACETALGKEIAGEGLVGLTRGFMHAGASRVIASLWQVDDAATSQLMAWLYQSMEKEGLRPAEALRAAQIKMIGQKKWSRPFFWAAFELQGEWR